MEPTCVPPVLELGCAHPETCAVWQSAMVRRATSVARCYLVGYSTDGIRYPWTHGDSGPSGEACCALSGSVGVVFAPRPSMILVLVRVRWVSSPCFRFFLLASRVGLFPCVCRSFRVPCPGFCPGGVVVVPVSPPSACPACGSLGSWYRSPLLPPVPARVCALLEP